MKMLGRLPSLYKDGNDIEKKMIVFFYGSLYTNAALPELYISFFLSLTFFRSFLPSVFLFFFFLSFYLPSFLSFFLSFFLS